MKRREAVRLIPGLATGLLAPRLVAPPASGVDGRLAVRMAQAAQESLRRGAPVRIREVGSCWKDV